MVMLWSRLPSWEFEELAELVLPQNDFENLWGSIRTSASYLMSSIDIDAYYLKRYEGDRALFMAWRFHLHT